MAVHVVSLPEDPDVERMVRAIVYEALKVRTPAVNRLTSADEHKLRQVLFPTAR